MRGFSFGRHGNGFFLPGKTVLSIHHRRKNRWTPIESEHASDDPAQFVRTFVVQAPGQYTNVTPDNKSGLVVVTERSSVIRSLATVLRALDVEECLRK